MTPSQTRPTLPEIAGQLRDGLRVFGLAAQPIALARIALGGLPRYGMTVAGAIAVTAKVHGDRVALLDDRGAMTYAELGRAADRLAAALDHHGLVRAGTEVAVIGHDDRDLLIAAAAAGMAGARVTQLSPRMGQASVGTWLADSAVEVILHAPDAAGLLGGFAGRTVATTDFADLIETTPAGHPTPDRARRSAAVLVTSGTTGGPKGIVLKRRSAQPLAALALAGATRVRPGVPTLVWPPLHHGHGLAAAMLRLVVGSPIVTASVLPRLGLADGAGDAVLDAIRRCGVEVVFGVPAQLRALAEALAADTRPPPRLRAVLSGSDRLDRTTVVALQQALEPVVVDFYGSTEAGTFTLATGPMVADEGCVGRPVVGARVRIVGADGGPVPLGVPGQVRVRSLTASMTDGPDTRWLTLDDRGYLDDRGRLHLLGRSGPVARLGGEFVDPGAVQALLQSQPAVRRATVEVVSDACYGQRLAARVELHPGHPADAHRWRTVIREALGPAAVPREFEVVPG